MLSTIQLQHRDAPEPPDSPHRSLWNELTARGIRMTAQRRILVTILQNAPGRMNAGTLLAAAQRQDPGIDRATVYRMLGLLNRLGLPDEPRVAPGENKQVVAQPGMKCDSCHVACIQCGSKCEYANSAFQALRDEIAQKTSMRISVMRLEISGLCAECGRSGTAPCREQTGMPCRSAAKAPPGCAQTDQELRQYRKALLIAQIRKRHS